MSKCGTRKSTRPLVTEETVALLTDTINKSLRERKRQRSMREYSDKWLVKGLLQMNETLVACHRHSIGFNYVQKPITKLRRISIIHARRLAFDSQSRYRSSVSARSIPAT